MHREIQIKQFPIVTTHWWPKTRNERFVWENEQYLYRFLPLVHNHVQVIWVPDVCDVCARALWLTLHSHGASASTLDGGRVWSVVLTQLRGIFLLEDAHCHHSCRFWTVYSRIMMTSFKQTRLLSCIVFLYERSMYPFHSSVTRRQRLTVCPKRGALTNYCLTVLLYTVMYIPFGTKWWLFNFGMAQILFMD